MLRKILLRIAPKILRSAPPSNLGFALLAKMLRSAPKTIIFAPFCSAKKNRQHKTADFFFKCSVLLRSAPIFLLVQPDSTTHESETPRDTPDEQHVQLDVKLPADHLFNEVHNGKQGHWGLRETWKRLNQRFPGNGLPMQYISQCIAECPTCQKTRKGRREFLVPVVRQHLKPPHSRSAIGIDDVSITPRGKNGHTHITVIVNLFTKFVYLHPIKGCTAINLAAAVWTNWCYFGCANMIISDQVLTCDPFIQRTNELSWTAACLQYCGRACQWL